MVEYQVMISPDDDQEGILNFLNGAGKEGWELILVTQSEGLYTFFFKRKIDKDFRIRKSNILSVGPET